MATANLEWKAPPQEPCGCAYPSAGHPGDPPDFEPITLKYMQCDNCGAVWSSADDNRYVTFFTGQK